MYNNELGLEFEQGFGYENGNGSYEYNQEYMGETYGNTGELNEMQELEFAHELLNVANEQELNMFLGKLIKKAGSAVGNFARSSVGQNLVSALKGVAKQALPVAGGALGSALGGPLGGMIGGKLGSAASNLFELELEGLSPEDQEYEMARAYVRFANAAANNAASLQQQGATNPQVVLKKALTDAAQEHAPGLLQPTSPKQHIPAQGSWVRRGNTLIIQL